MKPRIGLPVCTNLKQPPLRYMMNQDYVGSLIAAGATPVLIPIDAEIARAEEYLPLIDGLLLPGGEDVCPYLYGEDPIPTVSYTNSVKDEFELALLRLARANGLPVFGICRGLQIINVAFGGSLVQDIPSCCGKQVNHSQAIEIRGQLTHAVVTEPGSLLARLLGEKEPLLTNTYHHQAIKAVGEGLVVSARARDGVIEGIETPDGNLYAVQWHPEGLFLPHERFRPLFTHLVELASKSRA